MAGSNIFASPQAFRVLSAPEMPAIYLAGGISFASLPSEEVASPVPPPGNPVKYSIPRNASSPQPQSMYAYPRPLTLITSPVSGEAPQSTISPSQANVRTVSSERVPLQWTQERDTYLQTPAHQQRTISDQPQELFQLSPFTDDAAQQPATMSAQEQWTPLHQRADQYPSQHQPDPYQQLQRVDPYLSQPQTNAHEERTNYVPPFPATSTPGSNVKFPQCYICAFGTERGTGGEREAVMLRSGETENKAILLLSTSCEKGMACVYMNKVGIEETHAERDFD